jgi:hypothetical protein
LQFPTTNLPLIATIATSVGYDDFCHYPSHDFRIDGENGADGKPNTDPPFQMNTNRPASVNPTTSAFSVQIELFDRAKSGDCHAVAAVIIDDI